MRPTPASPRAPTSSRGDAFPRAATAHVERSSAAHPPLAPLSLHAHSAAGAEGGCAAEASPSGSPASSSALWMSEDEQHAAPHLLLELMRQRRKRGSAPPPPPPPPSAGAAPRPSRDASAEPTPASSSGAPVDVPCAVRPLLRLATPLPTSATASPLGGSFLTCGGGSSRPPSSLRSGVRRACSDMLVLPSSEASNGDERPRTRQRSLLESASRFHHSMCPPTSADRCAVSSATLGGGGGPLTDDDDDGSCFSLSVRSANTNGTVGSRSSACRGTAGQHQHHTQHTPAARRQSHNSRAPAPAEEMEGGALQWFSLEGDWEVVNLP